MRGIGTERVKSLLHLFPYPAACGVEAGDALVDVHLCTHPSVDEVVLKDVPCVVTGLPVAVVDFVTGRMPSSICKFVRFWYHAGTLFHNFQ